MGLMSTLSCNNTFLRRDSVKERNQTPILFGLTDQQEGGRSDFRIQI